MCADNEVDVVNVVGSGKLGVELDLYALATDLSAETNSQTKYDPDEHTGMHVRLESGALITLYRTGSYHIVGVDSERALFEARDTFIEAMGKVGLDVPSGEDPFSVRNLVTTTSLGDSVNLNALAIGLGLEQVEYEPEQFPGLVYRPTEFDAVVLIFGSGKMVVTGVTSVERAKQVRESVADEVYRLLG
ncbi:transcription factor [Salinibaculum marinum]|uniref:TATA-box-binding protein n=1 Tax=Salinibaculum marinum TaxID=3131993 RepID=UPI0030CD02A7